MTELAMHASEQPDEYQVMTRDEGLSFTCVPCDDTIRRQWQVLCQESNPRNHFYYPEIVDSAVLAWSELQTLKLIVGHRAGKLVFLQPLRVQKSLLGTVCYLLEVPTADRIEPMIAATEDKSVLYARFGEFLASHLGPDLIVGRSLTREFTQYLSSTRMIADGQPRVQSAVHSQGWLLKLPRTMDEMLQKYSSNFRTQIRRRLRKAEADGIKFRVHTSTPLDSGVPSALTAEMASLRALHTKRFADLDRESFFLKPQFRMFHDALIDRVGESGLQILFVEAFDQQGTIGSLYGIANQHSFTYLMIGFDPAYKHYSPGHLLLYHTVNTLIERGVSEFDFKCGAEEYKARWADHQYDKYDITIAFNWRGHLLQRTSG